MKKTCITLLTALSLSACALAPATPPASRDAIGNFAVDGRFALKMTRPDGSSENSGGRLSWTHENHTNRLLLANPLGIGIAELTSSPGSAQVRSSDGTIYHGDSPEQLLAELTGQPLPVSQLAAWLTGRSHDQGSIEYDALGRPHRLQEAGWQIEYSYDDSDGRRDALPVRLHAIGDGIDLRLRLEAWRSRP